MGESPDRPEAIETLSFLVGSTYRVTVLEALASEPRSRDDLRESTGVPRVTLGRVLSPFEERGWIERGGRRYRATLAGGAFAEALESFLDVIEAVQALGGMVEWLPADFPFDLTRLAGAEVVVPRDGEPMAPVRRAREWLTRAERVRVVSPVVIPETLAANHSAATRATQQFEGVFPSAVIETIARDPELAAQLREMIESGRTDVYEHEGEIPYVVSTTSEVAALPLSDDEGLPRGLIVTDDPDVHAWAEEVIDSFRDDAERVDAERFSD